MNHDVMIGRVATATQVSVTNTAALLMAAPGGGVMGRTSKGFLVKALSSNTQSIWLGGADVATTTGLELQAGESVALDFDDPSRIYAVSTSGTQKLSIIY